MWAQPGLLLLFSVNYQCFQPGDLPNCGPFIVKCGSFDSKHSQLGLTATTVWRHQVGHQSACLWGTGAQKARWERGCYVFIKSTRKQLRRLCSLDTPHLFIIVPLAVTLLFIIACWFICSSSLKPHLTSSFTLAQSDVVGMYKDVALEPCQEFQTAIFRLCVCISPEARDDIQVAIVFTVISPANSLMTGCGFPSVPLHCSQQLINHRWLSECIYGSAQHAFAMRRWWEEWCNQHAINPPSLLSGNVRSGQQSLKGAFQDSGSLCLLGEKVQAEM